MVSCRVRNVVSCGVNVIIYELIDGIAEWPISVGANRGGERAISPVRAMCECSDSIFNRTVWQIDILFISKCIGGKHLRHGKWVTFHIFANENIDVVCRLTWQRSVCFDVQIRYILAMNGTRDSRFGRLLSIRSLSLPRSNTNFTMCM